MEKRTGNLIVQAPGGTAAKNSSTYKVALPSSWIKAMGFAEGERQIELHFDGTAISIARKQTMQSFLDNGKLKNDKLMILSYYDGETLCTKIAANISERTLVAENYTADPISRAFGNNAPTWEDLQSFLEDRCIPRTRGGLREYLEEIGVDTYAPLEIIQKTQGRMAEDNQWLKVEQL